MRYSIVSDIHGNLPALEAVLEISQNEGIDQYLCLGDIVGYGPNPKECLELIQSLNCRTVAGNHDFAVLGKIEIDYFNVYAKEATLWTRDHLPESGKDYLLNLPLVEHLDGFSIVHGSLYSPELFDYVQTSYDAYLSISQLPGKVCFFGHSHIPISFIQKRFINYSIDTEIDVDPEKKFLVNVGSVGQPRDNDPRASFAIFDTEAEKICIKRVAYDISAAVSKIREVELPDILGERLKIGR